MSDNSQNPIQSAPAASANASGTDGVANQTQEQQARTGAAADAASGAAASNGGGGGRKSSSSEVRR